jgi:hypothetical protein
MGYRKKSTLYTLKWPDGHDLAGLEVTMRGLSVDGMVKVATLGSALRAATDVAAQAVKAGELFTLLASKLVAWNLEEEDGTPVPATLEGVQDQDLALVTEILTAWVGEISSVDNPLPPGSNGMQSPSLADIPMQSLPS